MEQPVFTAKEFASLLGISKSMLLRMEAEGELPAPVMQDGVRIYMPYDIPDYLERLGKGPLVREKRRQIFLNFKGGTGKTSVSAFYSFRLAQLGINPSLIVTIMNSQNTMVRTGSVDVSGQHRGHQAGGVLGAGPDRPVHESPAGLLAVQLPLVEQP